MRSSLLLYSSPRLLPIITLLAVAALSARGQGEVVFANGGTATRIWIGSVPSGWPPSGTNGAHYEVLDYHFPGAYTFALFSADVGVNIASPTPWLDPSWSFTGAYATNTSVTTGGRIFGQQNADGSVTVPGHLGGTSASLMVIGWNTAAGGTTLNEFIADWNSGWPYGLIYGYSSVATILLGDGGTTPAISLFGVGPGQISGFGLGMPEPASTTLISLGVATLLWFRRPKPGWRGRIQP